MAKNRCWPLVVLLLTGCPGPTPGTDAATTTDGGNPGTDADSIDDAAQLDARPSDASGRDLATATDAGLADASHRDGNTTDAATPDSTVADASTALDAERSDPGSSDRTPTDAPASDGSATGPFIVRGAASSYHVTVSVTVRNSNATLNRLTVLLPAPQTNDYQDVANLDVGSGSLRTIPETDDRYALFTGTSGLPAAGASATYAIAYDVTLYQLHSELGRVTAIAPYDTDSDLYRWYTGPSGVYVVPDNATIQSLSSTLWQQHPDIVGYARAAYEYVAASYDYLDPYTGLHPLTDILAAGGGDCGNLSSIYVSLLRARGIPSRHLVTMRPDGSAHVWADFYLQDYGWVPVDVTYKQSNPGGDYIGRVALSGNGIIENKEVALSVDSGAGTLQLALLQTYAWWYWSSTPSPAITSAYTLSAVPQ